MRTLDFASAETLVYDTIATACAPKQRLTVSQWADRHRIVSKKTSPEPGPWKTSRTPLLREPMDCMSAFSTVQRMVCMFPIQFGKSEILTNVLGYTMEYSKGPIMLTFPAEVSMKKFMRQKWQPFENETPIIRDLLASVKSRDASNTQEFKDYDGGQLYFEHAGTPERLKSTSVKTQLNDEVSSFAANLSTGDDPIELLDDRVSAYESSFKQANVGSPGIVGVCRIVDLYESSDRRLYNMPCPHCGDHLHFEWSGLHWSAGGKHVRYVCPHCGAEFEEHHKTDMMQNGVWIPRNPDITKIRGYTANCLYYQIGLGPRWHNLVEKWLEMHSDPAKLKVFVNSRLAEGYEDPSMRKIKLNVLEERAENYPLRVAPIGVGMITAGVDTQDDRLEVQIVGWGRRLAGIVIDYVVLHGKPADPEDDVWNRLEALLIAPIEHINGHHLIIQSTLIDAGGHCTETVKLFTRRKKAKRVRAIFGAVPKNAPVLSKPKAVDINYRGNVDRRGVLIQHVGTIAIKQVLFGRMATDADKPQDQRLLRFSANLPSEYFSGVVSETYDPKTGRYVKKRGARNEPLDTLVYAYAATHHPELRLQTYTLSKWDEILAPLGSVLQASEASSTATAQLEIKTKKPKRSSQLL